MSAEKTVRVYRPEAKWMVLVAAKRLSPGPVQDHIFQRILEGVGADTLPASDTKEAAS